MIGILSVEASQTGMWPSYVKVVPWIRWLKGIREVAQWVSLESPSVELVFVKRAERLKGTTERRRVGKGSKTDASSIHFLVNLCFVTTVLRSRSRDGQLRSSS